MISIYTSNDTSGLIGFLIAFALICSTIALAAFFSTRNKKINTLVEQHSEYVKSIKLLNNKYQFNNVLSISDTKTFYLSSKRQFDTFDYNKKGSACIRENSNKYSVIIRKLEENRELLKKYKDELKNLKLTCDTSIVKKCNIKLDDFIKREIKIGSKLIKCPQTNYSITIRWQYISPAGRNHYSNSCTFSYDAVKRLVEPLQHTYVGTNDRQISKPLSKPKTIGPSVSIDDIENIDD